MKIDIPNILIQTKEEYDEQQEQKYDFSWDDLPNYIISKSITSEDMKHVTINEQNWNAAEQRLDTPIGRRILIFGKIYNQVMVNFITKRVTSSEFEHYIVIFKDYECSPYLHHFTLYDMLNNNLYRN